MSFLFDLISSGEFVENILGKSPSIHLKKVNSDQMKFTIDDFETALWSHEGSLMERLRVNNNGSDTIIPRRANGKDLFRWAIDQFAIGSTLVFNGVDSISPRIAHISRELDIYYEGLTTANAFLTPPNSQGFPPHFDTHDVFIIQLVGTKKWSVYEQEIEDPLPNQIDYIDKNKSRAPILETILEEGDILYIPRGFIHEAKTGIQASLHITMGIRPKKPVDLLSAAIDVIAENHSELRRNIVIYGESDRKKTIETSLKTISNEVKRPFIQKRIKQRINEIFVTQLRPIAGGHILNLLQSQNINEKTIFIMREESPCSMSEEGDKILLTFPGMGVAASKDIKPGYIIFPAICFGILKYLINNKEPFGCENILGPYNNRIKLEVLKKLLEVGILKIYE